MEKIHISELTRDESNNLKGGFTAIPNPNGGNGAPSLRNGDCSDTSGIFNDNCGCAKCKDSAGTE